MAIKVTKRATNDGARYSISGLTFDQLFRIRQAMCAEEEKMKGIASQLWTRNDSIGGKAFNDNAKAAHEVFIAANNGCI